MSETAVAIPNRALFKAAEVCELAELQPYVLRSWEAEFPELGLTRGGTSGRMYRRADVEQVLRIKHLLFVEGLTLAGIRRRMDEAAAPVAAEDMPLEELLGRNARERLEAVKQGLRGILDLLSDNGSPRGSLRAVPAAALGASATGAGRSRAPAARKIALRPKAVSRAKPARRKRR